MRTCLLIDACMLRILQRHDMNIELSRTHCMTTSIDWKRCSSDKWSTVACQEQNRVGQLVDGTRTSESMSRLWMFEKLRVGCFIHATALVEICNCDTWNFMMIFYLFLFHEEFSIGTWINRIHSNFFWSQFESDATGKLIHSGFRQIISEYAGERAFFLWLVNTR